MVKFYLISETNYAIQSTWNGVLNLEIQGYTRVPYSIYMAHKRKIDEERLQLTLQAIREVRS